MVEVVEFPKPKLRPVEPPTPEVNQDLVGMIESLLDEAKRGYIVACAVSTVTRVYGVENQYCDSNERVAAHELISGTSLMLRRLQDDVSAAMVEEENTDGNG